MKRAKKLAKDRDWNGAEPDVWYNQVERVARYDTRARTFDYLRSLESYSNPEEVMFWVVTFYHYSATHTVPHYDQRRRDSSRI